MQSVQGLGSKVNGKYHCCCVKSVVPVRGFGLASLCKLMHICCMNLDQAILRHLSQQDLSEQSDLLKLLRADGLELTVSTLSRHLKKLGVRKENGRYQLSRPQRQGAITPPFTVRKVPPCLLILKTTPGFAQAMAFALDGGELPSLAGTIAGDDTIFAAPTDAALLDRLEAEIRERLGQGF
jgi:transcriptional regulator of arginine metabolism